MNSASCKSTVERTMDGVIQISTPHGATRKCFQVDAGDNAEVVGPPCEARREDSGSTGRWRGQWRGSPGQIRSCMRCRTPSHSEARGKRCRRSGSILQHRPQPLALATTLRPRGSTREQRASHVAPGPTDMVELPWIRSIELREHTWVYGYTAVDVGNCRERSVSTRADGKRTCLDLRIISMRRSVC